MVVGEIWRYPVKSMGGEQLTETMLTFDGIPGDRVVHARDDDDVLTARNHPALLGFHATLGVDGEPLVDGEPWSSDAIAERVRKAVGPDVRPHGLADPLGDRVGAPGLAVDQRLAVDAEGGVESEQRRMVARGQHVVVVAGVHHAITRDSVECEHRFRELLAAHGLHGIAPDFADDHWSPLLTRRPGASDL